MKKNNLYIPLLLFFTGIISRFPLVEKIQSHWDGPQYSIAIIRYSLEQSTPAPPGYPLYIALGKLFNIFIHNPHSSILSISLLTAAVGSLVFYLIGKHIYNKYVGIIAALIFLTGSTFYYFSLTAYPYGLTPIATVLLAYVTYLIVIRKKQLGLLFGLTAGIFLGIRPQEVILVWGLLLLGFFSLSNLEKVKSATIFLTVTLIWFIPLLLTTGIDKFFVISIGFLKNAITNNTLTQHIELMIKGFLLSFGVSSLFLLYLVRKAFILNKNTFLKSTRIILFYFLWIVPGFAYNLLLRTEHAGYQMTYLAAFLLLISYSVWQVTKRSKILLVLSVVIITGFNLFWFFYDRDPNFVKPYRPTSFHYSDIRKNDLKTGSKVNFILKTFDPKTTLIVTTDVLWRPYMYYLKNFQLTDLSGLDILTPSFIYTRRDAKNWRMHEYQNTNLSVVIPKGISTLVFTEDDAKSWISNYPFRKYDLPGNSNLISISVSPHKKIIYKYHQITLSETF